MIYIILNSFQLKQAQHFSCPEFPYLQTKDNDTIFLTGLFRELHELMDLEHLEQSLVFSKHSINVSIIIPLRFRSLPPKGCILSPPTHSQPGYRPVPFLLRTSIFPYMGHKASLEYRSDWVLTHSLYYLTTLPVSNILQSKTGLLQGAWVA